MSEPMAEMNAFEKLLACPVCGEEPRLNAEGELSVSYDCSLRVDLGGGVHHWLSSEMWRDEPLARKAWNEMVSSILSAVAAGKLVVSEPAPSGLTESEREAIDELRRHASATRTEELRTEKELGIVGKPFRTIAENILTVCRLAEENRR